MNLQQKQFNESAIKNNREEIAKLQKELQNPRIRKVEQRKKMIEDLRLQIDQAEAALA